MLGLGLRRRLPNSQELAVCGLVAWEWDLRGHEIVFSDNCVQLFGGAPDDVSSLDAFEARVHPEDRERRRRAVQEAVRSWSPYAVEYRLLRPGTGGTVWVEERGGVRDADGPVAAGVLLDVTDRKAAELRGRAEQQTILDSVRAMIWHRDADGRVLRCNRAAAQSIGLPVSAVEGRLLTELFPEQAESYMREDACVIAEGRPKLGVVEALRSFDGTARWIQTDRIPFLGEAGERAGVVVFAMDVTERKRAEDVLRESEKTQLEFVANVSHEFRTPVAAIKGFAETLLGGGWDDRRVALKFVRIILNHADRLKWLVEDLLTLSSLESGVVKLRPDTVKLSEFMDDYAQSVELLLKKGRVRLTVDVGASLRVKVDQAYFLQAIENLIGNAVKYNRPGGRVRVEAERRGRQILLSIRDTGIGIPPSHLPKIFDRFYRVNKGAASGATGLGLHIVKKIVEAHGGRIWAESVVGKGSSFHVLLPSA